MTFQKATGMRTPYISGSLSAKVRPGEDRDLHLVLARVLQGVVLEREPDRRVERLHLRRGVGDVHRVFVAALGDRRRSPAGILAPRHVAAAELGRAAVALLHDLLRLGNARIPFPRDARALARLVAVDVARAEEAHAAAAAHDDGEVLVPQLGFRLAVELEIEHVVGVRASTEGRSTANCSPRNAGL